MRKRSITLKLFLVTLLFFSAFLFLFMGGQTLFFKSFYLSTKTSQLEKNMEKFSRVYETENPDSAGVTRSINKFADENNAQLAILDQSGSAKYTPSYEFMLQTADNKKIKIPLSNIAYLEGFQNLKLAMGSEIEVEGFFTKDFQQVLLLNSIKNGGIKWENNNIQLYSEAVSIKSTLVLPSKVTAANSEGKKIETTTKPTSKPTTMTESKPLTIVGATRTMKANDLAITLSKADVSSGMVAMASVENKKITGKIVELEIPSRIEQLTNYNGDLLWSAIDYWNGLRTLKKVEPQNGKLISFHYLNPANGMDNIVLVKPLYKEDSLTELIFAVSSLQPVGEAVEVMKGYYFWAFLIALLLITAMAILYSRMISKPLIKMNQVAVKMAGFDFSEEVPITSADELGSLAGSLNQLSQNLGSSLKELTEANEQLQLDIEKGKALETMRKEFVASVSHELKTPLGIIKGFAEGVKDNIAESKREHYLNVILDEIEKMDILVLDLLDLAKLESYGYKLNTEGFYVADILNNVRERFAKQISEKEIHLKLEYEKEDSLVFGDEGRIEQVITNIMNNAIRHTEQRGEIRIGIVNKEETGLIQEGMVRCEPENLMVYIENSGSHIESEDLSKIWDKFYRTEKSRNRNTGGTGLGLSISKNILEIHQSKFGVENTETGVRFYFSLRKI